jgi:epoxyqueuosine reductase QueG
VAYTSGLGTFGLCGGLITRKGKAVRLGSVIVQADIAPTRRPYSDPFAYCLHYHGPEGCAACAERCPVGSANPEGRDKPSCAKHLDPGTREFVTREYGFNGYGCGLCQTGVPCESGIPAGLEDSDSDSDSGSD